ncbi:peroxiredoxin [Pacificimonas flava]|uniref:Alkyl hydroperoxide reductase C n=2 Tax=Pacificimonas TaxID=1960290 RepID=A0A219B6I9_9SPHN|nr:MULTISPECIES: peroxiredoxin [Pacificimonas]MBZ6378762.1 peroxiredoxin [Pacificimonas aurantium]OWV33975.1 peroxiredoxin [Pacificimonas flava]
MLTIGDKLPEFNVPAQKGVDALPDDERISHSDFEGKWKILFWWPKDFTFVCPTEIIGYGDLKEDFEDRDAVLIGASTDTDFVHFAWRKSDERLAAQDFWWLADNKKELANALGIVDADAGVALRATFIVDPDNIIQHITINGLNVGRNPQETLRILDALQTDELCPCNWDQGQETLKPAA